MILFGKTHNTQQLEVCHCHKSSRVLGLFVPQSIDREECRPPTVYVRVLLQFRHTFLSAKILQWVFCKYHMNPAEYQL